MNFANSTASSATAIGSLTLGIFLLMHIQCAWATDSLFISEETLAITLTGPFDLIDKERDKAAEYPATLSFVDAQGDTVALDAKLSVRGKFRLQKSVCSNAQLWVNLQKRQVKGTLFDKQNKLKLLVQCRDSKRYAEYLGREHQAYQMFSKVSDISFDTRILEVTFRDADSGKEKVQPGMFIQHQKRLAKEHGMKVVQTPTADRDRLDPVQSTAVAVFHYLVSNTDFSLVSAPPGDSCCHNVKVLEDESGTLFPVPYDFDSSGFVSAPYAEPSGAIGQNSIKHRIYRGYCTADTVLQDAIDSMREHRGMFNQIIAADPLASAKGVKRTTKFVDKFYNVVDDPKKYQKQIVEACR